MIRFLRYVDLMLIGILYASHRISQSSEARVPSSSFFHTFFLSRRTHTKLAFCVAVISGTKHQKIVVETWDESIKIELLPPLLKSLLTPSVRLRRAQQNHEFECVLTFEIIKMKAARKVSRYFSSTADLIHWSWRWIMNHIDN